MPGPNGLPKNLNQRHHLIAYMILAGATSTEAAKALDMERTYVSSIVASPMFKALMDQLRVDMRQRTIGNVIDRIVAEGPNSVEALVRLRDHAESEQVQATAARDLLDRNPETAKVSREDRRSEVRILLDTAALHRIAGVMAEDAEFQPVPAAQLTKNGTPAGILPLDAVLEELKAAESAAEAENS